MTGGPSYRHIRSNGNAITKVHREAQDELQIGNPAIPAIIPKIDLY